MTKIIAIEDLCQDEKDISISDMNDGDIGIVTMWDGNSKDHFMCNSLVQLFHNKIVPIGELTPGHYPNILHVRRETFRVFVPEKKQKLIIEI